VDQQWELPPCPEPLHDAPGPKHNSLRSTSAGNCTANGAAIVAGTLFVLPSLFVLLALSVIYVRLGSLPWIAAVFNG